MHIASEIGDPGSQSPDPRNSLATIEAGLAGSGEPVRDRSCGLSPVVVGLVAAVSRSGLVTDGLGLAHVPVHAALPH